MNVQNVLLHTSKVDNKDTRTTVGAYVFFVNFEHLFYHIIQDINLTFT